MPGAILVVDDNQDIREGIHLTLSRLGYEIWLAPNGNSAIQLMNQSELAKAVHTVICDLAMPNGSGTDLITYLRNYHPAIPIIVYSGTDDTEFLDGILHEGVCDWMRKPASRDTMLQKVRTAIHLFTLRQQQNRHDGSQHPSVSPPMAAAPSDIETLLEYHNRETNQ